MQMLMKKGQNKALVWAQDSCPLHHSLLLWLVVLHRLYGCDGKGEERCLCRLGQSFDISLCKYPIYSDNAETN